MVSISDAEVQVVGNIFDLCTQLWHDCVDERHDIRCIGHGELGGLGLQLGILIELEDRLDVLAGVVTTIRKTSIFPEDHIGAVSQITILDDPHFRNWASQYGGKFPKFLNYLSCVDVLCSQIKHNLELR